MKSLVQPAGSKVKMEPGMLLGATKVTLMGTECCGGFAIWEQIYREIKGNFSLYRCLRESLTAMMVL